MIYHYTSIDTLHNILKKYRLSKDKKFIELWASNIYFMNDPLEMLTAPNIVTNLLESIESELLIDDSCRLSKTFKDIETIKQRLIRSLNKNKHLFIISFSNKKDTLPMWSMYTKQGKGVCLCLNKEILLNYFNNNEELQTKIVPVSYNLEKLEDVTRNELCSIYRKYIEEMSDDDIPDKENLIHFYQYRFVHELAPLYKDSAYNYEREERLICSQQRNEQTIDFRVSENGYIIPYRKINIPVDALKNIIIGPSYNYDLMSEGLKLELIFSGVKATLEPSTVNYRAI